MSTKINDLAHYVDVINASGTPAAKTASISGNTNGVDLGFDDGNCFAIQDIGTVSGTTPTWSGKFQESNDNGVTDAWTDVTNGAFAQVTASNNTQVITFQRTKRWLSYVGTIGGTSTPTFGLDVLILQQRKQGGG